MKIITVFGYSGSGKTTTIEEIIKELTGRGYSVGTVKDIHNEEFSMDNEGTNTDRHKKAGATLVAARGLAETDILYQSQLPIQDILKHYNQDYVILEGDSGASAPMIITGKSVQELDEKFKQSEGRTVIAVSGVVSTMLQTYKKLPVIDGLTEIVKLVDLIEEKAMDWDGNPSGVVDTVLTINGREIPLLPFIRNMLGNIVIGSVKELKGYKEGAEIVVKIRKQKERGISG